MDVIFFVLITFLLIKDKSSTKTDAEIEKK